MVRRGPSAPPSAPPPRICAIATRARPIWSIYMDLSRIHAAPSARLGHLAFESHGAFPAEGRVTAARVTLRANKSETFDYLKFTLRAQENDPMVMPERLPSSLPLSPEGPATPSSAGRVVAAPVVASAEFTAGPKRRSFRAKNKLKILSEIDQALDTGGISCAFRGHPARDSDLIRPLIPI